MPGSLEYDVQWPCVDPDMFLVIWKHQIYLFSTDSGVSHKDISNNFVIGSKFKLSFSAANVWSNAISPQCVAWVSSTENKTASEIVPKRVIAVSLVNGLVKLFGLSDFASQSDRFGLRNKELIPRFNRNSLHLAWNPWKWNLLAQCLDKPRNSREPSILIWDVTKYTGSKSVGSKPTGREPSLINDTYTLPLASIASECSPQNTVSLVPIYTVTISKKPWLTPNVTTCDKPLCDLGIQDTVSSFAWLSRSSFIAGMSGTYLKVFDLSDPSKACQITSTRAVYGLTVDPLCSTRIASFCEHQISIWKLNNLEKPVYTFIESSDVQQIKWSPIKEGWLGVLLCDSYAVKMYDTFPMFSQPLVEYEHPPLERHFFPSHRSSTNLIAFSWHPSMVNCLLTLDQDGSLDIAHMIERSVVTWSATQDLLWSYGGNWTSFGFSGFHSSNPIVLEEFLQSLDRKNTHQKCGIGEIVLKHRGEKSELEQVGNETQTTLSMELKHYFETDIANVMRRRAELGYGLNIKGSGYVEIVKDDAQLHTMWTWIEYIQVFMDNYISRRRSEVDSTQNVYIGGKKDGSMRVRLPTRCLGAVAILSEGPLSSGGGLVSEVIPYAEWQGIDARLPFSRYRSSERSHVLRLCMWPLDDLDDVQRPVFESLCNEGQYERAAAMALINLKFESALSYLKLSSGGQEIGLVALALSGYASIRNELWKNNCADLIKTLQHPYLRVMFTFLSRQGGDFDPILNDDNLCLIDRVAFACLYLNDDDLLTYIRSTCNRMINEGYLEAILLTGLCSSDFVTLIQNYVDLTGDVQTGAIVGLHACHLSINENRTDSLTNATRHKISGNMHLNLMENKSSTNSGKMLSEKHTSLFISIGGSKLANWVQCYRDLLDQWQMWFYRADFDVTYQSRLVSDYMSSTTNLKLQVPNTLMNITRSGESELIGMAADNNTSQNQTISTISQSYSLMTLNKVRSNGLVAGANQVFVACGFCGSRLGPQSKLNISVGGSGSSLSSSIMDSSGTSSATSNLQMHGGGGKQTICQHCRKPLPRCSICLMHLGTNAPLTESAMVTSSREAILRQAALASVPEVPADMAQAVQLCILGVPSSETNLNKTTRRRFSTKTHLLSLPCSMADWFVWCQACRHGGHASHLIDWFYGSNFDTMDYSYLKECPVSGCQCRCAELDATQFIPQLGSSTFAVSNSLESDGSGSNGNGDSDDESVGLDDFMLQRIVPQLTVPGR